MRPPVLPDTPLGSLRLPQLAALGVRCHIYLRALHGEAEFDKRLKPWRQMIEQETVAAGVPDAEVLPVLVRRTEDMHDLDRTEAGQDLAWLLAAYSVRSGVNP